MWGLHEKQAIFPTSFGLGLSQEIDRICDLQVLKDKRQSFND